MTGRPDASARKRPARDAAKASEKPVVQADSAESAKSVKCTDPAEDHVAASSTAPTVLPGPMLQWLQHLETARRYSVNTLSAYRRDLLQLMSLAGGLPLADISSGHVRRYLAQLHSRGMGPRTLARMLASWRGFYQWWAPQVGLPGNPVAGLRGPKAPRGLPKALSVDQTQALLDHVPGTVGGVAAHLPEPERVVACRDRAMFELFYSSGLRLSELTGLDVQYVKTPKYESAGWIDLEAGEVNVLGKGGKRRSVPVGETARTALTAWLADRPSLAKSAGGGSADRPADQSASQRADLLADANALFVGVRGARIAPRVVQAQLAKWAQEAGVPAHVHPHVLRHSFASHVLQSAEDLRAVQEMLGHASISTTQIYTRLDFQHLAKVYDKAHPRAMRVDGDDKKT
jgi:integrase/recombinase XerC